MKHKVRIFEVDRAGQPDSTPQEHEPIEVEARAVALARDETRRALVDAGWQVRAVSHAVDGGLVAYVVKPEKPAGRKRQSRRQGRRARSR